MLYFAVATLPMLAALLSGIEPVGNAFEFAAALGLTAAALLFLQFLSSGRYESFSGAIGIDRTMGFHRIAALALLVFAVLHPLTYLANLLVVDPLAAWKRLHAMLASPRLRSGALALLGLFVIVAVAAVRTRFFIRYEYWRVSHGLLAIMVAALALHHALTVGTYSAEATLRAIWLLFAGLAAGAVILVYAVRPWRMWREDWRVERVNRVGEHVIEMLLRGPATTTLRMRAGQFIWMTLAPNRPPFHDHPFSIASAPTEPSRLRLIIREAGDCTNQFRLVRSGTRVAIDGPHGSFVLPQHGAPILMIAGGVGIAPLLGMLEEAAAKGDRRSFHLLYAARAPAQLACLDLLRELKSQLDLSITCLVDQGADGNNYKAGPFRAHHATDLLDKSEPRDAVAVICGPAGMIESAADALLDAGLPETSVHYERFDYGAGRGHIDKTRRRQSLLIFVVLVVAMAVFSLR